jgi:hypothetical protein
VLLEKHASTLHLYFQVFAEESCLVIFCLLPKLNFNESALYLTDLTFHTGLLYLDHSMIWTAQPVLIDSDDNKKAAEQLSCLKNISRTLSEGLRREVTPVIYILVQWRTHFSSIYRSVSSRRNLPRKCGFKKLYFSGKI